jgi:hypothetical protein
MRIIAAISTVALGVALTACENREPRGYVHIGPDEQPGSSF